MVMATLGVVAAVNLLAAVAFLLVARTLSRREHAPPDRLAARAFATWWAAMGGYMALQAALFAYAAVTTPRVEVFLLARLVRIPLLVVAVWALVFHISYIYTGREGLALPLAVAYVVIGVAFFMAGFLPMPVSVEVSDWHVALAGEGQTVLYRVVYGIIGGSIIVSILGYVSIIPKLEDRMQRLRVALVAGSIFLWVASGLIAFTSTSDLGKFLTLAVLGPLTAATVLIAYHPPPALLAWLEGGKPAGRRVERRAQLRRRVIELV